MHPEFDKHIEPPAFLDGAKVIQWAWSGQTAFGVVGSTQHKLETNIHGLAICQYENSKTIYRFSCDKNWKVVQDSDYASISEAIAQLPKQYQNVVPEWVER